jgi:hypothetical protein
MAYRKEAKRRRARQLRKQGWALRRIASEVNAALSSVSLWVRDIPSPKTVGVASAVDATTKMRQLDLGLRRCGRCNRSLPLTDFNRHPTDGYQWWCRDCFRAYFRARGQLHRDQTHDARRRRRQRARAFIRDYLETHPCSDCGVSDPVILEFDHVGPKRAHVGLLSGDGTSLRRIKSEIAHCEVVCVNCHRIRTATRGDSWRLDPMSLDRDPAFTPGERRNMVYLRDLLLRSRCTDCGDDRLIVLEFDHVRSKRGNVTQLARRGCGLKALQAEISKCEVRCGNCHRRRTLSRLNFEKWTIPLDEKSAPGGTPTRNHRLKRALL